jgi:Fur family ferric uptake transcriptional regulator
VQKTMLPLSRGLRHTLPRRLVWEALGRLGPHCTAEEISMEITARNLGLPQSTIYRALTILEESGAISVVHFGGGPARYEPAGEAHPHAVCRVCGSILHLENALLRELEKHLEHAHHFTPQRIEAVVVGTCARCTGPVRATS